MHRIEFGSSFTVFPSSLNSFHINSYVTTIIPPKKPKIVANLHPEISYSVVKLMNRWWSFNHLIKNCVNLKQTQQLHAQTLLTGLLLHQPLACQILNSYAGFSDTLNAHKVFGQIPQPDIISITSLISLHLQSNHPHKAISVFSSILSSGIQPDGFAVVAALSASARLPNPFPGKTVHALIYRRELFPETVVGNALVDMYSKNGNLRYAETVFAGMAVRDSVSWSSMLNAFAKCGGLDYACKLFDEMPTRDSVSWTVMITGHVHGKQPIVALELFRRMLSEGCEPTLITVVGVLSACADVGALDLGSAIHGYVCKMDARFDVTLHNALIDMYSKSGNLRTAEEIFNGLPIKDVYTWTSMISGFAVHGCANRAVQAFYDMRGSGVSPNEITFLAVLLACSHGGLIDEGRKMFDEMRRVYNCMPQLEHFGCMVDLLGRAGRLKEAELLIGDMGMDADCVIWRSLLSAALIHGDTELAEMAGTKITEREPEDDGVYVLMWNMYASSGRWKEAREVRKKMGDMKVLKKPGCSWIEVEGIVHEFLVDDRMSVCQTEIYSVMEELRRQMRTYSTGKEECE